jgi:hypothetical protein
MERNLTAKEYVLALGVFGGTIPLQKFIWVDDSLGLGDRPWTNWGEGNAWLHLGPIAQKDLTSTTRWPDFGQYCDVFIHEMTHVWQYYHGRWVKWNSVSRQVWATVTAKVVIPVRLRIPVDDDIYKYTVGDSWSSYNVEQQAQIVEDWFSSDTLKDNPGKSSLTDARYQYIEQIRASGQHWADDMSDEADRRQDFERRSRKENIGNKI